MNGSCSPVRVRRSKKRLNRLRDYVIPSTSPCTARPAYSDHYGPNSGEVNDQLNYFHGLARGVNQGG